MSYQSNKGHVYVPSIGLVEAPLDRGGSIILLNWEVAPEFDPNYGFVKSADCYLMDHDGDGILERMVKFDRAAVQDILDVGEQIEVTISGEVGGIAFEGSDIIRVIDE